MGLFGLARNLMKGLGTTTDAPIQYYSVLCPLGHRVRGQRTEGYQALRCPACGEGVFVLPTSPLPEPVAPATSPKRPRIAAARAEVDEGPVELHDPGEVVVEVDAEPRNRPADAEIIWEDEADEIETASAEPDVQTVEDRPAASANADEDEDADAAAPAGKRRRTPSDRRPARARPPGRGGSARSVGRSTVVEEAPAAPRPTRRRANRPLLIFSLVGLVVVGTVALRVWRSRRQQYPLVAELGRVEGIPALEQGDFDKAYQLLSAARHAVDALGGRVEGADEIRWAADEAAVFINLAPQSLEELLDEAARANPQEWKTRFDDYYKGGGVVVDTTVKTAPDSPAGRYELDYLVTPFSQTLNFRGAGGARPDRSARIDLDGFELFKLAEPKAGDHVLFGARLADFRFDAGEGSWVVQLEPKSGVFIRHAKALEALGWPPPGAPGPANEQEGR